VLVDTSSLIDRTITAILSPACDFVHPAWVNELTTPIATSRTVLQLSNGVLVMVAPCEVEVEPDKYPSLGLATSTCGQGALTWTGPDGKAYFMHSLAAASPLLPFKVVHTESSDPLGEGAVSQIALIGASEAQIVFRHIMPPMTLGIALAGAKHLTTHSSGRRSIACASSKLCGAGAAKFKR